MRLLILGLEYSNAASYYDDWRDAFTNSALYQTTFWNLLKDDQSGLLAEINESDAVVLLHACTGNTTEYLSKVSAILHDRAEHVKLFAFVGNEFNCPYNPLSKRISLLASCRPDIVATQLLHEAGDYLYSDICKQVISVPHALNESAFKKKVGCSSRKYDIGTISYKYLPYLGDNERNQMLEYFSKEIPSDYKVCIDQTNRLSRSEWADFLNNCKTTISTEAGTWYLSRDDELVTQVYNFIASQRKGIVLTNDSLLRKLVRFLPVGVKKLISKGLRKGIVSFECFEDVNADFSEIYSKFFKDASYSPVYSKCISSRNFDAIGTGTTQVLLEGRYNDILLPGEHYINLKPDYSNIEEVLDLVRDDSEVEKIAESALDFVLSKHTYRHRAETIYDELNKC